MRERSYRLAAGGVWKENTTENNFNLEDKTTLECVWRDVRKRINETSY